MIFNFRLVSDEVDNFRREINIDADATFLDLRNAICDSVGYDKNQMCSFFLCDENWEKGHEITLEDMGSDSDEEIYLMDETVLSDYLDDGDRMIFVFDYMTDRCFFIELKKSIPGKTLKDPVCVASMGTPPAQIMDIDEFEAKSAPVTRAGDDDFDEDFYGSDGYSDDEFDAAGFDEMTFDDNM
ncbi:hypothetical protein [uncultured Muribaculum sp.]|uniref:IS1096 element passenger TnpR family protein n=1 Tax=uncultured Muribaculum sp. TaxID=1918613 RepID=UPI00259A1ED7|nr:hypothetical protein [uncultured Muribaculum sp.]